MVEEPALVDISALGGVRSYERLRLQHLDGLRSLHGLEGLTWVDDELFLQDLGLQSVEALASLKTVGGDVDLWQLWDVTDLHGLENLRSVGG